MNPSKGTLDASEKSLVHDVLADTRRRYALKLLNEAERPLALEDIAREIVRWERETLGRQIDDERTERVHVSLYHVHVPKLSDAGIIRYFRNENRVTLTDGVASDEVAPLEG